MRPSSIEDVAEGHLCCGCGVCAYLEPTSITMVNIVDRGLRPSIKDGETTTSDTLAACPGAGLAHDADNDGIELIDELADQFGPVVALWEGYATDAHVRSAGSSAGAATTLAAHCLEGEGMAGVLHTGARTDIPYLNTTVFSTTPEALLAASGSRYAPASPCDGLQLVEQADGPCVFIGKPCDVAATQSARRVRPALDAKLGLTIAVFCAGTPSTEGTLVMLRAMGVTDPESVVEVRYRGNGWPGLASVKTKSGFTASLTYEESWGAILEKHRQWRCHVCADHTGEFADVAVGDPWYREVDGIDPGRSLIVARTEIGRRIVLRAIQSGALTAWPVEPNILPLSQPNLVKTRGAVWARLKVASAMGAFTPTYRNMPMFSTWRRDLTAREKFSSTAGTARRVLRKGLRQRIPVPPPDEAQ